MEMNSHCGIQGRAVSLLSKFKYSADTASVASRHATARNIADSAVTRPQPRSNTRDDAAIVRDHVTFHATFGFQPINSSAHILPMDNFIILWFSLIFDDIP